MILFQGSIVALITPFQEDGSLDRKAYCELIEWHIQEGTDGFVCFGTTGEVPTLTKEEKLDLLRLCIDVASKKVPVIANTGTNDTRASKEFTQIAKEYGADGCLAVVPYYNRPTQEGCIQHFQQIADVGLDCILYHHPKRTGVTLTLGTIEKISQIPHVVAIKEASGNLELCSKISNLPILSGDDDYTLQLLKNGAVGSISVVANVLPGKHKEAVERTLKGDFAGAENVFSEVSSLCKALSMEINPQPVKYAVSLLKKCKPVWRLPMIAPSIEAKKKIEEEMKLIVSKTQPEQALETSL